MRQNCGLKLAYRANMVVPEEVRRRPHSGTRTCRQRCVRCGFSLEMVAFFRFPATGDRIGAKHSRHHFSLTFIPDAPESATHRPSHPRRVRPSMGRRSRRGPLGSGAEEWFAVGQSYWSQYRGHPAIRRVPRLEKGEGTQRPRPRAAWCRFRRRVSRPSVRSARPRISTASPGLLWAHVREDSP